MAVLTAPEPAKVALRNRLHPQEWKRLGSMFGFIAVLHIVGSTLLILGSQGHYHLDAKSTFGIGTGFLAYTLGMRHAFDADHISAIDNTTRKLMAEGKRPLGVGFFFSLGHSSVVFLLTVILGLGAKALGSQVRNDKSSLHHYTSLLGTTVSGGFLLLIAILNVIVLVSIVKVFRNLKKGHYDDAELEKQLNSRGLLNRFFGPLARSVDSSWKMYPIGFLFGLGFDTATEVALLVLAGSSVASGLPFWAILSLPLLFAAGMSTLDTIDGSFMNFAYGWAFSSRSARSTTTSPSPGCRSRSRSLSAASRSRRFSPTSSTCPAGSGTTPRTSTSTGPGSSSSASLSSPGSWPCRSGALARSRHVGSSPPTPPAPSRPRPPDLSSCSSCCRGSRMTDASVVSPAPSAGEAVLQAEAGWQALLRRYGLRVTEARLRVLDALQVLGHAAPEQVYELVRPQLPSLNSSTVYRTLEVLAEHGLVAHAHLEQPSATYMLATHADHAHLVCRGCRTISELDHDIATTLAGQISHAHGFDVDIGHLSLFGRCARCTATDLENEHVRLS